MKYFFDRYNELIIDGNKPFNQNDICGEISFNARRQISKVMHDYDDDIKVSENKHHPDDILEISALEYAVKNFNERRGSSIVRLDSFTYERDYGEIFEDSISTLFSPFLFDIIERQYSALDDGCKKDFQSDINTVFSENAIPWIMYDGEMLKLDQIIFEQKMKIRTMEEMQAAKDAEPAFQSASDEFRSAVELFTKGNYAEAIVDAEKSYESIMKIVCGSENGTAFVLTGLLVKGHHLNLSENDDERKKFRDDVLMSLPHVRNTYAAHGAGSSNGELSKPLANLAVNLAAALDTYLIEEYEECHKGE